MIPISELEFRISDFPRPPLLFFSPLPLPPHGRVGGNFSTFIVLKSYRFSSRATIVAAPTTAAVSARSTYGPNRSLAQP